MSNLLIPQGDDFELLIELRHGVVLRCPVPVSAATITIEIVPMGASMVVGQKLMYGDCDPLILAENLAPTDTIAVVTRVPTRLESGTTLTGNPIDVTGWTGYSSIRGYYGASTSWDFVCNVFGNPMSGTFSLLLPHLISAAIPANCTAQQIHLINGFTLGSTRTWDTLPGAAYVWDFDTVDTNARRKRRENGSVLVSSEVTL